MDDNIRLNEIFINIRNYKFINNEDFEFIKTLSKEKLIEIIEILNTYTKIINNITIIRSN